MVAGTGRTGVLSCPTRRGKRWRRGPEGFDPLVLELLEAVVPSRERNAFIVAATEEALRREQLRKVTRALREKPAWSDEDHPDLMTLKDVDRYVRRLRETWMPRSWDEIIEETELLLALLSLPVTEAIADRAGRLIYSLASIGL